MLLNTSNIWSQIAMHYQKSTLSQALFGSHTISFSWYFGTFLGGTTGKMTNHLGEHYNLKQSGKS